MSYCGNCGQKLKDDARFCPKCGTKVQREEVDERPDVIVDDIDALFTENVRPKKRNINKSVLIRQVVFYVVISLVSGLLTYGVRTLIGRLGSNENQNTVAIEESELSEAEIAYSVAESTIIIESDESDVSGIDSQTESSDQDDVDRKEEDRVPSIDSAEYVIADSDTRLLTEQELDSYTKEELRIARNEIYARHGRKFLSSDLQTYLNSCSWYTPLIEPEDFDENLYLNNVERTNAKLIDTYEEAHGYK